ncbi:hypothetical protein ACH4E7_41825 [Kitasatospora sp. NPDC018058]|uniref:hypothetical protein n=1 Tax=Kitasatospora sp. NPDC018058 TaxID=3364025 RepID=UPI0037C093D5
MLPPLLNILGPVGGVNALRRTCWASSRAEAPAGRQEQQQVRPGRVHFRRGGRHLHSSWGPVRDDVLAALAELGLDWR